MTTWYRGCEATSCVEVRRVADVIEVRDSKDADGPVLRFTLEEWVAFISGVFTGDFDHLLRESPGVD